MRGEVSRSIQKRIKLLRLNNGNDVDTNRRERKGKLEKGKASKDSGFILKCIR